MDSLADNMTERWEPPIAPEVRRKVCLNLFAETYDRLERELRAWLERRQTFHRR